MATVYVNVPCADLHQMQLRYHPSDCLSSCEGPTQTYWSNCYPEALDIGCVIYSGTVSAGGTGSTCDYSLDAIPGFYATGGSSNCYYQGFGKQIADIQILFKDICDECYQIYYFECTNDKVGACADRGFLQTDRPDLQAVLYIFTNAPYTGTVSVNLNYYDFVGGYNIPSTEQLYFDDSMLETLTWTRKQWIAPDCSRLGFNETTLVSITDLPFFGRECQGGTLSQVLNSPPNPNSPQYKVIYPGSPAGITGSFNFPQNVFKFPGHPGYLWMSRYDKNSPYDVYRLDITNSAGQTVYNGGTGLYQNGNAYIGSLAAGAYNAIFDVYYKNSVCLYQTNRSRPFLITGAAGVVMRSQYETDTDISVPASNQYFKFNNPWNGIISQMMLPYSSMSGNYWNWLSLTAGDQIKMVWTGSAVAAWKTFTVYNAYPGPYSQPNFGYGFAIINVDEIDSGPAVNPPYDLPGQGDVFTVGAWTDNLSAT
jgi:hypothetical protein